MSVTDLLYKDSVLAKLAHTKNVAQFVSYGPDGRQRHSAVKGHALDEPLGDVATATSRLLEHATSERRLRVRTFLPDRPQSQPFTAEPESNPANVSRIVGAALERGLFVIVNESIDVNDGGVSGVLHGPVVEFAPKTVPRCVEGEGVCSLPRELGLRLLQIVYNVSLASCGDFRERVEFSIHPSSCGLKDERVIIWELQELASPTEPTPGLHWPHEFSRHVGDKVFGLIMAHLLGAPVPETLVWPRALPGFRFGVSTGTGNPWLRTCPREQAPGKFTTINGWGDPFALLQAEDPAGDQIASVIQQEGVAAEYSGALRWDDDKLLVEGVRGSGEQFMMSECEREELPESVLGAVHEMCAGLQRRIPRLRLEWVYDGQRAWVVQLHSAVGPASPAGWIYPGDPKEFVEYDTRSGVAGLRALLDAIAGTGKGIVLHGNIGLTSHMCDLLRQQRIPSRLQPRVLPA